MITWVLGTVVFCLGIVAIFGLVFGALHIEYVVRRHQSHRQRASGGPHEHETAAGGQDPGEAPAAPARLLLELSDTQRRILEHCESPRTMAELMEHIGLSHRTHFRRQHLDRCSKLGCSAFATQIRRGIRSRAT